MEKLNAQEIATSNWYSNADLEKWLAECEEGQNHEEKAIVGEALRIRNAK